MQTRHDTMAVADFGGQTAHLIGNGFRRLNIYSIIIDPETSPKKLPSNVKGIVLSGGPSSVYDADAPQVNPKLLEVQMPILGLCYGHQLLAQHYGGEVEGNKKLREDGPATLEVSDDSDIFKGLEGREKVLMSHGDFVTKLPPDFIVAGSTAYCNVAAMSHPGLQRYGLQFHPEVADTPKGLQILGNFADLCRVERTWTMESYEQARINAIRQQVGGKNVMVLVSGGVDSAVTAALIERALGPDRTYALHIDTGFMRKDESREVEEALRDFGLENLEVVDASQYFYDSVRGVTDPEKKRQAIGKAFVDIQKRELKRLGLNPDEWLLGQGTIYPDIVESGGKKNRAKIKSHHNRVPAIRKMIKASKVVEPLSELYKDEVRELGLQLGLPENIVYRQPFPGPGLAIRILCFDGQAENLGGVHQKVRMVAAEYGLAAKVLPVRSVGVQGDSRSYKHPVALAGGFDWDNVGKAALDITRRVKQINRGVYYLGDEELTRFKAINGTLTPERVEFARELDQVAMEILRRYGLLREVSQMPTVLLPVEINNTGRESVIVRPVVTPNYMTVSVPRLDEKVLAAFNSELQATGAGAVFLDVTPKPPGTVEWE